MSHTIIQSRNVVQSPQLFTFENKKKILTCTKMSIMLGQTACITTTKSEYKHFSETAGGGGGGGELRDYCLPEWDWDIRSFLSLILVIFLICEFG